MVTGLESFYDVLTSLEKIGQVVDKKLEEQEGTNPFLQNDTASITLHNLSYHTKEGDTILNNVNLTLEHKDRLLIEGSSGSGKTTLLKILSGLIEPSNGAIYINDHSYKGMNVNEYRSHVGQVLPEQMPFEGTLLENITFGNKETSIDTVNKIVKDVGLQEFVRKQAKGINSEILSQGQDLPHTVSKKLLLARAIVHEPKILLLKDALEHFEPIEAKRLMNYLTSPEKSWLLIVAEKNEEWKTVCNKNLSLESN